MTGRRRAATEAGAWMRWRSRLRVRRRLRQWWRGRDPRRAGLPKVFANSFPKSGTHLLLRCVTRLPGMVWEELGLRAGWLIPELGEVQPGASGDVVPVGVGHLRHVKAERVAKILARLQPGEVTGGHMPYSDTLATLLAREGIRPLLILRDPRDVAVSLVYHILERPGTWIHEYCTQTLKSDEERLLACIEGIDDARGSPPRPYPDMAQRLDRFLPWLQAPANYTTWFERLVGPQGGGSAEAQRAEIERIARHLGFPLTSQQTESIAHQLFWEQSLTFRRGQIGSWREHFREKHKAAFKRVAGQALVELGYERDFNW